MIRAGDAEVVVAGGMESMTNAPYLLPKAREGSRLGDTEMLDSMIHDGLWSRSTTATWGRGPTRSAPNSGSPERTRTPGRRVRTIARTMPGMRGV